MRYHPAVLMVMVWAACMGLFYILPFQLENRVMTLYGFLILTLFIAVFCGGALAASRPQGQRPPRKDVTVDFQLADRALMAAAIIAILGALADTAGRNIFDLAASYEIRSDRAGDLMAGRGSASSIWFQIAFVTYPAGYVFIVREVAFRAHPAPWRIGLFGLLPVVMASLAMGGRAPLFYALLMLVYGFALRQRTFPAAAVPARRSVAAAAGPGMPAPPRRRPFRLNAPAKIGIGFIGLVMLVYFIQVFAARADVAGGIDAMFGVAGGQWGVNFNGPGSNLFFSVLGPDATYMVFVFVWYWIQGFVMSNAVFSSYEGPALLGVYGVDLVSALIRRVNGEFVANGYAHLGHINVYGFLPSAFGALYVDLKFFGLLVAGGWGWLTGWVYRKVKQGLDPKWVMAVPFITLGILFSTIGTPIGFSNGLVTHFWLVVTLILARTIVTGRPAAAAPVARRRP
ncbi:hypothetical protein N0B44_31130 [Roseibacterium beibuensis]|uniref:hypothetical protein n=1 Tax=[Roseibacterium] beibuensis TaxID=1193142 RepID=UPI00217CCFB2|nr:hypothetical protein [Roseibacterium beibuensis]MCS6627371.1 hypothetical protein [Roseibacterium beibuensis]